MRGNPNVTIRPFDPADEAAILSWCRDEETFFLWTAGVLGPYPLRPEDFGKTAAHLRFTALEGGEPAGFFILRYPAESREILRVGFVIVDPDRRRRGIGNAMLRLGAAYAKETLRALKLTLGVFEDNAPACACYASVGFRETGAREIYSLRGKDHIALEMELGLGE